MPPKHLVKALAAQVELVDNPQPAVQGQENDYKSSSSQLEYVGEAPPEEPLEEPQDDFIN